MEPTLRLDFNACTQEILREEFNLIPRKSLAALQDWLAANAEVTPQEHYTLRQLSELMQENAMAWNEQELSLHLIGPLFSMARFTVMDTLNLFAQRPITATVANVAGNLVTLNGRPDGLLASGYFNPKAPYFCFQEYKRERDPHGDPAGQCLAAMLAGQVINGEADKPVYGCYVVGQNWYFLTLMGHEYAISSSFSAATDEIFYILGLLKTLKQLVLKRLQVTA